MIFYNILGKQPYCSIPVKLLEDLNFSSRNLLGCIQMWDVAFRLYANTAASVHIGNRDNLVVLRVLAFDIQFPLFPALHGSSFLQDAYY